MIHFIKIIKKRKEKGFGTHLVHSTYVVYHTLHCNIENASTKRAFCAKIELGQHRNKS